MKFRRLLKESNVDTIKAKEWLDSRKIKDYTLSSGGLIDVDGNVFLNNTFKSEKLTEIPFPFGTVNGVFDIDNQLLTSLKNSPRVVKDRFRCFGNTNLLTLEGGPEEVYHNFTAYDCYKIKSLKGAPKYIGGEFDLSDSILESLEGMPEVIGGIKINIGPGTMSIKHFEENLPKELKGDMHVRGWFKEDITPSELRKMIIAKSVPNYQGYGVNIVFEDIIRKYWKPNIVRV